MKNNQKMKVHFIQHETFEAPAAYLEWAKQRNHTITFSKVYENQALPTYSGAYPPNFSYKKLA